MYFYDKDGNKIRNKESFQYKATGEEGEEKKGCPAWLTLLFSLVAMALSAYIIYLIWNESKMQETGAEAGSETSSIEMT